MGDYRNATDEFLALVPLVEEVLGKEKARLWWTTRNPMFGDITPAIMVAAGRYEKVRKFIEDAVEENRAALPR